jgi:SAM-dependent methyltransferase
MDLPDKQSSSLTPSSVDPWVSWLSTPLGRYVLAWQQQGLDRVIQDIFGYHALQMQMPGLDALAKSRMSHRLLVCLNESSYAIDRANSPGPRFDLTDSRTALITDSFEQLPIDTESVDLVVLAHILEFAQDPHSVLREAARVVRPGGRIVVTGFNPVSLWGARRLLPGRFPAQSKQLISVPRLKDWFKLLSFEMSGTSFGCFAPPVKTEEWLSRWSFFEKLGDKFWPICGAVYCTMAVKQVVGLTLIGPAWRNKNPALGRPAVASPTRTRQVQPPIIQEIKHEHES